MFPQPSRSTQDAIGAATEIHKGKGPGLFESIYERMRFSA